MFRISQSETYLWPVKIEMSDGSGKRVKSAFDAEFRRLSQAQIDALIERSQTGEANDRSLACEVLAGWKGVQDEAGDDLPFSETNRDKLLDVFPVRPAIIEAFFDSLKRGREKN